MGPQPAGYGNLVTVATVSWKIPLRWGRSQLAAEMNRFRVSGPGKNSLRWGRSQLAAEMRPTAMARASGACFNGAAASWLRKSAWAARYNDGTAGFNGAAASWLRKWKSHGSRRLNPGASMGPQPAGCGNEMNERTAT